ncbi:5-(carboxyamino)imidazole ribonucleotide synthase [Altererythrobacter aquiaggeris]|uniref:5-(carboxyamino)imidazole ribonucleotide synthase n=1 Tax=Aestuarierythrobacter aquiaggeris TaxID=1898396 RepID=UPI003015D69D
MIPPGSTIGILGGGQLGRMLAIAAAQMGYRCHIYAPEQTSVAAEVSAEFTCAGWYDHQAMARFVAACDVVTYEFENVPVEPLAHIPDNKLHPHPRALETAQDRVAEKQFVSALGGNPAPYAPVPKPGDLVAAVAEIGTPGILKTCRDGYDGKGQWRIDADTDLTTLDLPDAPLVYEGFVNFAAEFSVILVRAADGDIRFYESAENVHEGGILALSSLPASAMIGSQVSAARKLAAAIAAKLEYIGVLTCEFFATSAGPVFNEMAPRVHNSGHWTIEGAATSQFANHIRAICGLALGATDTVGAKTRMLNLIGDKADAAQELLADPLTHVHLYGKREAREGRKMGHATRIEMK